MAKMSVADAAEYLNVSKEAIHNRIRRGSLHSVVEDGIKLVILDENSLTKARKAPTRKAVTNSDDRYYKLLEEQNAKLQTKVDTLESETRSLRDQKELMLIQEREKIEQIYKEKDEQLKNILNAISSKFMLDTPKLEDSPLDAEIEEVDEVEVEETIKERELISLKRYLKEHKVSSKKSQKIKDKFKKRAKKDERIITVGKRYYIDLGKFDYSDLL